MEPMVTVYDRVFKFLSAVRPMLGNEITTAWLAPAIVHFDGGPILAISEIGPPLRALGFRRMFRRKGVSRHMVWITPGAQVPSVGRPRSPSAVRRPVGVGMTMLGT